MYSKEFLADLTQLKLRCRMSDDPVVRAYPDVIAAQLNRVHAQHNELLRLVKLANETAATLESVLALVKAGN